MTRRDALLSMVTPLGPTGPLTHILMTFRDGRVVSADWPQPDRAVAFGSLMKPFVALAYGFDFPEVTCTECWKPGGHGRLAMPEAVARSCNAYFLALARACSPAQMERTALTVGLPPPQGDARSWIGLVSGWAVPPMAITRAYGEMFYRAPKALLRGLRLSARWGTARALGLDAFAKTGTGPCMHSPKGSGDGYAVALFPAEAPQYILLTGCHDRPGSETARAAGRLIRRI